jgi:hypothetical protein
MKIKLLFFLVLLAPLICYSQVSASGDVIVCEQGYVEQVKAMVLGEGLLGPKKILLQASQMKLESSEDVLSTNYTLRIFSEGIIEDLEFENIKAEDLMLLDLLVFPRFLEQPYTLFIDLELIVLPKTNPANKETGMDRAGDYHANVIVQIIEI